MWNSVKTAALLGLLSALLLVGGLALGGQRGITYALILAVGMNFFSYFFSEKLALSMSGAEPLTPETQPQAYARVAPMTQRLAERMGLPMPKLWLIPEQSPNAFATGRSPAHSSVAVTYGLLQLMNDREVEGVIAHELGHVKHRDILISSIAAMIASALTYLAQMALWFGGGGRDEDDRPNPFVAVLMLILAPVAAGLIQMAISRSREYEADAAAAKYTGSPDGLISALGKLEGYSQRIPMDASPSTAHMYIIKPFSAGWAARLFSTHPATEERIRALEALRR